MATCYLGTLPTEVIYDIFERLDLRDLGHFVTAARFLYKCFENRKRPIIFRVLQNQLGSALENAGLFYGLYYSDPKAIDEDRLRKIVAVYKDMKKIAEKTKEETEEETKEKTIPSMEELTYLCRMFYAMRAVASNYSNSYHNLFPSVSSY
ncbi:hypothetical protein GGR51DRAFT_568111 [Nemania sp. FL0031]|nr:hypothetical protein GGR51DRAFT_568111 [Nemania sp. FL0031]